MTEIKVAGMTCDHCVKAVKTELETIPGVSGVTVSLNSEGPSAVAFASEGSVTPEQIGAAIDEAGYELA
jgi:copper chaperone